MSSHISNIDATCLAIFYFEGGNNIDPTSRNIRNNNPGNLRPYLQEQDEEEGYRVFGDMAEGWQALYDDISFKLRHHLKTDSTLLQLLDLYAPVGDHNNPTEYANFVCKFLTKALGYSIDLSTPLKIIYPEFVLEVPGTQNAQGFVLSTPPVIVKT